MLSGCAPGLIYTNVTQPLTVSVDNTPVGSRVGGGTSQHLRIPVPRARLGAEWDSRAIGAAAKEAGLEKVYYADLHTLSILAGTWRRETIRVWGE